MNTATCKKCGETKPVKEFYKHQYSRISGLGECAECTKARVRANRLVNVEYYRQYDKERYKDDPRVAARHMRYWKTPAGKLSHRKAKEKWQENNPRKRQANVAVGNAVRDGVLVKPSNCEQCGKQNEMIHGHHDDYAFPLSVRWLCPKCHTEWHKENGEAMDSNYEYRTLA